LVAKLPLKVPSSSSFPRQPHLLAPPQNFVPPDPAYPTSFFSLSIFFCRLAPNDTYMFEFFEILVGTPALVARTAPDAGKILYPGCVPDECVLTRGLPPGLQRPTLRSVFHFFELRSRQYAFCFLCPFFPFPALACSLYHAPCLLMLPFCHTLTSAYTVNRVEVCFVTSLYSTTCVVPIQLAASCGCN